MNKSKSRYFLGILLIFFGLLFLFQTFDLFDIGDFISTFWPLILILYGIKLLMDRKKDMPANINFSIQDSFFPSEGEPKLIRNNFFGDINIKTPDEIFQGGSVSSIFGDIRIDFADLIDIKEKSVLNVSCVFGSITVILPPDLPVRIKGNTVIGDLEMRDKTHDGFFGNMVYESPDFQSSAKNLSISCSIVFGSIRVL